jgi:hypothetical protein
MSQPQNLFYKLPKEIFLSGIYPFLLQTPPFEVMNNGMSNWYTRFDLYWMRLLNASKGLSFLKKTTRYVLLKNSNIVTRFLNDESFRNYVFDLVFNKSTQVGIDLSDWYRNQPSNVIELHNGSLFFPLLNGLHYVNLSSVFMDIADILSVRNVVYSDESDIFTVKNVAYLSLFTLNFEQVNLSGNIISLCLKDCGGIDFKKLPSSLRFLSLTACGIKSDLSCLSTNIEKLQLLHCDGIRKEGIKSLNFLKSFHFSSATNDTEFNDLDYSEFCSDVPEIQISFYSRYISFHVNCIDVNCFTNVISLTLTAFRSPSGLITGLPLLKYLDISMKGGCDGK